MLTRAQTAPMRPVFNRGVKHKSFYISKEPRYPEYHLIKKCARSKLKISAKANFSVLASCKRFASEKRAMSFNFNPRVLNLKPTTEYTCEVLHCTDIGGLSLTNDTRYDYYSIFGNTLAAVNWSCVPTAGVFYLLNRTMNYTDAVRECDNKSSVLADVISEKRTEALAQLLSEADTECAYVSLKRNNGGHFAVTNGDALECMSYRAWAPGHPKKGDKGDCVVLTRHQTWQSVPCGKKQAVICELIPGKPYTKRYFTNKLMPHF
ncbi:uncharacterized protein [Battus philenor]|uniref:uncharacterized protein n=1 Tax=Battus philenor TaxID=42288 RepID=UPI0035CFE7A0